MISTIYARSTYLSKQNQQSYCNLCLAMDIIVMYANLYLEHLYTAVQNKLIQYISRVRLRIHAYSLCMRRCSNFKCQNAHTICHSLLVDKAIFAYNFVLNNFRLIVN